MVLLVMKHVQMANERMQLILTIQFAPLVILNAKYVPGLLTFNVANVKMIFIQTEQLVILHVLVPNGKTQIMGILHVRLAITNVHYVQDLIKMIVVMLIRKCILMNQTFVKNAILMAIIIELERNVCILCNFKVITGIQSEEAPQINGILLLIMVLELKVTEDPFQILKENIIPSV